MARLEKPDSHQHKTIRRISVMMSTINEYRDTDTYTRQLARTCYLAADHAGMSLHTHFQPEITILEVRGAVDAYNAERLSDHIDDLATGDRPLIHELSDIPAKQIHRWEGEGGFIPPERKPRRKFTRRRRGGEKPVGGGNAM
jgi:hypothetical protein